MTFMQSIHFHERFMLMMFCAFTKLSYTIQDQDALFKRTLMGKIAEVFSRQVLVHQPCRSLVSSIQLVASVLDQLFRIRFEDPSGSAGVFSLWETAGEHADSHSAAP